MQIGRKEAVQSMRHIWPTEPQFSDWLVTDDGLALIADDIGIQIENPRRESRPGDFPCDIVGYVQGKENHVVVIENQFGKTDHDHLGKLLTYAAMHSAMTGIWIAERASDDHRKAVDWLNENTPFSVSFYLVELGAIRIGNSPVAPQLRVVSRPNLQAKIVRERDTTNDLPVRGWRRDYWEQIYEAVLTQMPSLPLPPIGTSPYASVRLGRGDVSMDMALIPISRQIRCDLWIGGRSKRGRYAQLFAQRTAIEAEMGQPLTWEENPGQKSTKISLTLSIDSKDEANRARVVSWFAEKAPAFYQAFFKRVQQLTDTLPDDDRDNDNREIDSEPPESAFDENDTL